MKPLPDPGNSSHRHPIAVVAERTGLSQDLLRVWERRYGAVTPVRRAGGQRLYSDADIERLALLEAATRAGRSISQVAGLPTDVLGGLVNEDVAARERRPAEALAAPNAADIVEGALAIARRLDSAGVDNLLRRAAAVMGISAFIESVAAPLLRRVGDEWHAGRLTIAQEHLVSSLLDDIMSESMRSFAKRTGARRLLVTTPARERHAIGAALVGAAAAIEGWNVLYLGADVPAAEIADAAVSAGVSLVAVSIVYVDRRDETIAELRTLRLRLPADVGLIVGGGAAAVLAAELSAIGVRVESSIAGFIAELRRHRGGA